MVTYILPVLVVTSVSFTSALNSRAPDPAAMLRINRASNLTRRLMKDYEKSVNPYLYFENLQTVTFGLEVIKVEHVDELAQTISFYGLVGMYWEDPRLRWNISEDPTIDTLDLPYVAPWKPSFSVDESVNAGENALFDDDPLGNLMVYFHGIVYHLTHVNIIFSCQLDMTRFPFDQHHCPLDFKFEFRHGRSRMPMRHANFVTDFYEEPSHGEWEIEVSQGYMTNKTYYIEAHNFNLTQTRIRYDFYLRRRSAYYKGVFVTPAVLLAILVPVSFLLPSESPQKISLGGTLLVCVFLLLVMLDSTIPSAQASMPIIGQYYLAVLILVSTSLIVSVVVGNLVTMQRRKHIMPYYIKKIFLDIFGRFLFVTSDSYWQSEENKKDHSNVNSLEIDINSAVPVKDISSETEGTIIGEWRQLASVIDRMITVLFALIVTVVSISILHA